MTDEHEWVRRLLAEAGGSAEPMPPEVGDRIEAALVDAGGTGGTDGTADDTADDTDGAGAAAGVVVPMTRPRQRRWGGVLLAAAAITVGGYSLTATGALDGLTGSDSAGDAAMSDGAAESGAGPDAQSDAQSHADDESAGDEAMAEKAPGTALRDGGAALTARPALSSSTLRRDAVELARSTAPLAAAADSDRAAAGEDQQDQRAQCVPPPNTVRGARVAVTYDGAAATAVVRERAGRRAVVQVWACDARESLARVVVPLPR